MKEEEKEKIYKEFHELVNMSPGEIEDWLEKDESKEVGQDSGDGESIGRKSAKKIVKIKRTNKADLSSSDYEHMQKVDGYIKRHKAQRPEGDVKNTPWRYSLMNWGHDPLK
jgi:hypothetical protein